MRIEAVIERGETCLPQIKKQTKCAKMTDENDATIIKNGINGVVAGSCSIGGGGGGGGLVANATVAAINVSRGNAINLSGSGSGGNSGANASSQRMQYSSSGSCPSAGNESSGGQSNQDQNTSTHTNSGSSNNLDPGSGRPPTTGFGGRLQFFKDGKFILELARAREGERTGWISVPRKTFWPPSASTTPATNSTYPKNESSTSLSFSDDNSSIQSSPWQRDHCWKQTAPRKGVSKEMCMFFKRTKKFTLSHDGYKTAQLKRRRPHDNSICKIPFTLVKNGFIKSEEIDSVCIKKELDETDGGDEANEKRKMIVDGAPAIKIEDGGSTGKKSDDHEQECKKPKTRAKLNIILEKLIDRLPTGLFYLSKVNAPSSGGVLNHFPATVRINDLHNHQQHVSPRKRILRELEKVSLEDNSTKRSRAKVNAANALAAATSSSSSSNSQHANSALAALHRSAHQNSNTANNNAIQTSNGNGTTTDANSNNNSSRLYSSYSIHSLLGNTTSNSKGETNSKDSLDSTLQIMLTSPNSSETYYSSRSAYTSSGGKRKSPNYNVASDSHNHNRRSSRESPNNYGSNYPSESSLSPDPVNRYKSSGSASSGSTSFHPYLSSPKYSSNAPSPTMVNDSYKPKSGYSSGSPSHSQMTSKVPTTSRSPIVSTYSQQSPLSNKNNSTLNNSRFREQSPVESSSPGSSTADRRDGTPRTVPKKTVAFRQQFSSPTSSPSVVQCASETSSIYKSPSDQKRKNSVIDEQRTLSPETSKLYQASLDQLDQQHRASLLRATQVLPPSSYYYLHPPHGPPGAHSSQPSYIPSLPYYPLSSYAAAVAALRNPLWMHYQTAGLLPGPSSRLPFPYNGESGLGPPHPTAPPGLSSMHLPSSSMPAWPSSLNLQNSATDDPVSLVNVKDEHNADVPLNLSKH